MNSRLYRWSLRVSWAVNVLMAFTLVIVVFFPLQMGRTPWVACGEYRIAPTNRGLCIWKDDGFNYPFFNGITGLNVVRDVNDQRHLLYSYRALTNANGSGIWALAIRPWFFWPIFTILPAVQLFFLYRQRRRQRKGCCIACNYDLRGNPAAVTCPECGTPRTTQAPIQITPM